MRNYVWDSALPYSEYLQAKSFICDVKSATREAERMVSMDISSQTRDIIVSKESFRESMELFMASPAMKFDECNGGLEQPSSALDAGFDWRYYGLDQRGEGISALNATFQWGFGAVLASLGHMNDTLSELVKIAKTPVQTVAFNHFEIARDAFRKGLYRECFEELDKAISGDHTSSGYKLEWRFHQMKGTLQLGFADCDISLYDLAQAEESFLTAARYGKSDYPYDAGRAFLSAGWSAYCQGKMKEALAHTEQAMTLYPQMGEAFFQASKVQMAVNEVDRALPLLAEAIELDRFYALKAAGDGDFQPHDEKLRGFFDALRKDKYSHSVKKVTAVLDRHKGFELAPGIENTLHSFVTEGANWPLMDMLNVVQNLDICKRLPIVERIKTQGMPVDIKETCTEQESYYEDVVIRPGGFFKKAVTEKQQKMRMVTKTRIVTKCSPSSEALFEFCPMYAGSFRMGANDAKIDHDFYLGRYPVTQQQWQTVMGDNPSYFKGERLPVETVSWDDVQTFIKKLNTLTGNQLYRLPSEVEWEYACRAGSASAYYFGDDASSLGAYAWYDGNSGKTTHPVGEKKPNGWGLYDMAGNVWEWCSESEGSGGILCGGSWCNSAERSRSADRLNVIHGSRRYSRIGFRLAFAL